MKYYIKWIKKILKDHAWKIIFFRFISLLFFFSHILIQEGKIGALIIFCYFLLFHCVTYIIKYLYSISWGFIYTLVLRVFIGNRWIYSTNFEAEDNEGAKLSSSPSTGWLICRALVYLCLERCLLPIQVIYIYNGYIYIHTPHIFKISKYIKNKY